MDIIFTGLTDVDGIIMTEIDLEILIKVIAICYA